MTVEQQVADTSELIQALTGRFQVAQLYVAGFSFGGTIATLTAARHPELVRAVVCVDLDVQSDVAERVAYDFALQQATRLNHKRAIQELQRIGPPPHLESTSFGTRAKWATNFGGVNRHATYAGLGLKLLRQLVFSRDYTLSEIIGTLRGMRFVQGHLLPDMANLNLFEMLPRLDVPVFLLQGRHDYVAHVMPAALPATGGRIDVHPIGGDTCPNSAHCATVSLGRLWQQQGKKNQAWRMLADFYSWSAEGFGTIDLQQVEALLQELSAADMVSPDGD